jgi:hypothetical protein
MRIREKMRKHRRVAVTDVVDATRTSRQSVPLRSQEAPLGAEVGPLPRTAAASFGPGQCGICSALAIIQTVRHPTSGVRNG